MISYLPISEAAKAIAAKLIAALQDGHEVLWLIPGGSVTAIAVEASKLLATTDTQKLHVSLTDERYGPLGHANSNWYQLQQAGFVFGDMQQHPWLIDESLEKTQQNTEKTLLNLLQVCTYSLGLFGMGSDGHTSGILPFSSAIEAPTLVHSYVAGPFTRITTTSNALKQLHEAILVAYGTEKWQQLKRLQESVPEKEQPAQILKQISTFSVYTDYIKGSDS